MAKAPEELLAERTRRIQDALALKQPDRIPINLNLGYLIARLGGVTRQALDQDLELAGQLLEKAALLYEPDMCAGVSGSPFASLILGDRSTRWAGHGLEPDESFQYVEAEYMKAGEYDELLADPAEFAFRKVLPRTFAELEGLADMPPLGMGLFGYYFTRSMAWMASPKVANSLQKMVEAGQAVVRVGAATAAANKRLNALGFPTGLLAGTLVEAPFDFLSDTLRGMRGIFLDMRRQPDKLLAAEDKVAHMMVDYVLESVRRGARPFATFPLHRGSDGFMSLEQFDTFYWPQLKWMLTTLVDQGITPYVYYEGVWDERAQYLCELPRGKTIGAFDHGNLAHVKEVAGDTVAMVGGFPVSLLQSGSDDEIRQATKKMCRELGKNGGFIMATGILTMDDCDPARVKVWVDATREYGVY